MNSSAVLALRIFVTMTRSQMPCDEIGPIGYLLPTSAT